jgi:hypothetical protein
MSTHQVIYIWRTSALNWQIYEFEASYPFSCVPLCFVICSLTPTCKSCVHLTLYCTSLHCTSHTALYISLCTVHLTLHCTSHSSLYISHCTVHLTLHCTSHIALYISHCTVHLTLHCTYHTALYISRCTVHLTLHCTSHAVLYSSHCTVPDELWIIYKLKLQYVMFENHFSSRKLGREESGLICSIKKSLLTAKFKQIAQIDTEKEFCTVYLSSGLWLSIFGPVIRKAPDNFETSGTTRALTVSHLRRLTFGNSAVRKSYLLCLYMFIHFGFESPWKRKHG